MGFTGVNLVGYGGLLASVHPGDDLSNADLSRADFSDSRLIGFISVSCSGLWQFLCTIV